MDSKRRIEQLATWWCQAANEQRAAFLSMFVVNRQRVTNPQAPTQQEIQLAILLAEATQGTLDGEEARALGQRLTRGQGVHGQAAADA